MNYLNIGIPPVVSQKYKQKYMHFWNQDLPEKLNRTIYSKPAQPYPELYAPAPTLYPARHGTAINAAAGGGAHINYYPEKEIDDPVRQLKFLLNHPNMTRTDMYNTQQQSAVTQDPEMDNVIVPAEELVTPENEVIVKADATLHVLIVIVVLFLLVNAVIIVTYLLRRFYYSKTMKRKLDVLTLDGTTDDEVKRSKFHDAGDESFILSMVRKKSNDYETTRRNRSPINGFLLSRELSTSTMDAHTKVCDWMSQELNKQKKVSPNFSLKSRSFFRRPGKVSVAIDATPSARSASVLMQQPAELMMKSPSFDYDTIGKDNTIICREVDIDASFIDSVNLRDSGSGASGEPNRRGSSSSLKGSADILKIDHRHSRSDPVQMYYHQHHHHNHHHPAQNGPEEDITVFIEDGDINVTSRRSEDAAERQPLSAEEALKTIQMRNYPKVLPNYPDQDTDYVSSSFKRRSLPPQCFNMALKTPPAPPPRTTSTLGRRPSTRRESKTLTTSPIQMAEEPPIDAEPEITCNVLHVGPLIPKSNESLYSTLKRNRPQTPSQSPLASTGGGEKTHFSFENCITIDTTDNEDDVAPPTTPSTPSTPSVHRPTGIKPPSGHKGDATKHGALPKIIIKPTLMRQNSTDKKAASTITRVQAPQDTAATQQQQGAAKTSGSKIPTIKKGPPLIERDRSTSDSSTASSVETVRQAY